MAGVTQHTILGSTLMPLILIRISQNINQIYINLTELNFTLNLSLFLSLPNSNLILKQKLKLIAR